MISKGLHYFITPRIPHTGTVPPRPEKYVNRATAAADRSCPVSVFSDIHDGVVNRSRRVKNRVLSSQKWSDKVMRLFIHNNNHNNSNLLAYFFWAPRVYFSREATTWPLYRCCFVSYYYYFIIDNQSHLYDIFLAAAAAAAIRPHAGYTYFLFVIISYHVSCQQRWCQGGAWDTYARSDVTVTYFRPSVSSLAHKPDVVRPLTADRQSACTREIWTEGWWWWWALFLYWAAAAAVGLFLVLRRDNERETWW